MRYEKRRRFKRIKSIMGYRWKIKSSRFNLITVELPPEYSLPEISFWLYREDYHWMLEKRREGAFLW